MFLYCFIGRTKLCLLEEVFNTNKTFCCFLLFLIDGIPLGGVENTRSDCLSVWWWIDGVLVGLRKAKVAM